MTRILSQEAASRIWNAHEEIEIGRKLLADIQKANKRGDDPNPRDPFGRQRPFTFGVPHGDSANRLLDVSPRLAVAVIEAHIADKERELKEASIAAKIELDTPPPEDVK